MKYNVELILNCVLDNTKEYNSELIVEGSQPLEIIIFYNANWYQGGFKHGSSNSSEGCESSA